MRATISVPLAALFVSLAGFNAWIMLSSRGGSARARRLWTQAHRICGYTLIAPFTSFCYFTLSRIGATQTSFRPALLCISVLRLHLLPRVLAKVFLVRYQKAAWDLLIGLGISIFVTAFTLVTVNVSIHYLRGAAAPKIPVAISLTVVAVIITLALAALLAKGKQAEAKPDAATVSTTKPADRETTNQLVDTVKLTLARIDPQTPDTKTLRFILPEGCLLRARPGQFLTLEWLIDRKPIIHSYSICSFPAQTGYAEITPKRVANGCVSTFLNDHAKPGLLVKARGSYGKFYS